MSTSWPGLSDIILAENEENTKTKKKIGTRYCAAINCANNYVDNPGLTFHQFPKKDTER